MWLLVFWCTEPLYINWAHNLHIIYMSSVWHQTTKKEPSVHMLYVYERAFYLCLNGWQLRSMLKMIVEYVQGMFFSLRLYHMRGFVKMQNLFYGCVPSYSASAVWSWFSFHCSGWYLVSSVWLLRNQMICNIIAKACMQDPIFGWVATFSRIYCMSQSHFSL